MSKKTNKQLMPQLRFPEFRDDGDWPLKKLGEVLDYEQPTKYLVKSDKYNSAYKIPVLTAGKTFLLGYTNETKGIFKNKLPTVIFDDFTAAFKFVNFPFKVKSSAMKMLIPTSDSINIKFIYEAMKTISFFPKAHKRYWISEYQNNIIPHPSTKEQTKIANCLSSIDRLIDAQTQKLASLKQHKKGLMQQLFPAEGKTVPKLRFPEFQGDGDWVVSLFDEVVEIIDGDRGSKYPKLNEFSDDGYCIFLNAKNVTNKGFKFNAVQFITQGKDEALRKGKLKRSDIILTTRGSVGHFAIYSRDVSYNNMRINSGMVILRVKTDLVSSGFFYSFSNSEILSSTIENIAFGNAQKQLTVSEIKNFKLHFPRLTEQTKITTCLSSIDNLIDTQTQKLDSLKQHKKGLTQQLFPTNEDESL
ncbi:MAG: hypothetical protein GY782_12370 [Gammaproteobacteria bacterium]|nr:hypothetical protein [Gammaproteobacteria bacterium]